MKIADILRTLASNLDRVEGCATSGQMVGVAADQQPESSPNGTTPSGNEEDPKGVFLPPLQQKQELLKKAVGVENVYDDGNPEHQHEVEKQQDTEYQTTGDQSIDRIKKLSGIPVVAITGLGDDEPLES